MPPRLIEMNTSSDTEVREGESVNLRCAAEASPPAEIKWRREDNQPILVKSNSGTSKEGKFNLYFIFD